MRFVNYLNYRCEYLSNDRFLHVKFSNNTFLLLFEICDHHVKGELEGGTFYKVSEEAKTLNACHLSQPLETLYDVLHKANFQPSRQATVVTEVLTKKWEQKAT